MPRENFGETIYTATAEGGRIYAFVGAITGTILGIILIMIGFSLITKEIYYNKVKVGIVKSCNCVNSVQQTSNGSSTVTICNTVVGYCIIPNCTIDKTLLDSITTNTETIGIVNFQNTGSYNPGQKVNLYYNENDVMDMQLTSDDWRFTGKILILIAILIISGGWVSVWMANKSKFLAAAGGFGAASAFFRR